MACDPAGAQASPSESPSALRRAVIDAMTTVAPPGLVQLDPDVRDELARATSRLLAAFGTQVGAEHDRFLAVRARRLAIDPSFAGSAVAGRTVLVSGGTGCIGSALLRELGRWAPARVVSLSRGVSVLYSAVEGVEYRYADLQDPVAVRATLSAVRPDIVFHLAAQHDPGRAEVEPGRTILTNVFGTRNLLAAARDSGVGTFVYASTGKALRPVTPDLYAASKKAGEWLVAEAARTTGMRCAAARFTHVVDNSIIFDRLRAWITDGSPIRLHGPDIYFYVQSAAESADLLLAAGFGAEPGRFDIHAIRDLGDPVSLTDLALGALRARDALVPVYFCGFESGYEQLPYPALFDPRYSGDLSPLINALEAPAASPSPTSPDADRFPLEIPTTGSAAAAADELERACLEHRSDEVLKQRMQDLSWCLLEARLAALPVATLERAARRARLDPTDGAGIEIHRLTHAAIVRAADQRSSGLPVA